MTSKPPSRENLQERGAQIEKEWREVRHLQIETLEQELAAKEVLLKDEREKFTQLKDDFKYNLQLLMKRDQELERYDATLGKLKAALKAKDGEISDLKIHIDDLKKSLGRDQDNREELQKHYQQKVREKHQEMEHYKKAKDEEIEQERSEVEAFRMNLERQLRQLEEELDVQRRELSAGFEEAMKRREKEYRTKIEELSGTALSYEMKAKFLSKEVDLVRSSAGKTSEELASCDETVKELEKRIKEKEWELCDTVGTKDARIAELESQLHDSELKLQRALEEFKRKHNELDKYSREKENSLSTAKECHAERERELEGALRDLRGQLEGYELEKRKLEWEQQDKIKEKDGQIERLREELNDARMERDACSSQLSQEMTKMARDMETAQESKARLKVELDRRKEDIERYKKDIAQAVSHHTELERSKAQLELDWQRRYEEAERNQYSRSEELIEKLTKARDEALALVKERERESIQKDQLLRSIRTHRDQIMATLKQHNTQMTAVQDMDAPSADEGDTMIQSLKKQNDALKAVIQRMREEMETAATSDQIPTGDTDNTAPQPWRMYTDEYAKSMENEIKVLKAEKRELSEQVENLRNTRVVGIEVSQDPGAQQRAIDGQHRALTDATRTHTQEIAALKQQIASLERRLEGDQTGTGPTENDGRKIFQARTLRDSEKASGRRDPPSTGIAALQAKLKTAIHHIGRLVKERQQLIELSNRLRSEVARSKMAAQRSDDGSMVKTAQGRKAVSPREISQDINNQLHAVEKLQYSLTTKELKMMQKGLVQDQGRSEVIQVQLSSSSSEPSSPHDPPLRHDIEQQHQYPTRDTTGFVQDTIPSLEVQEASPLTQSSSNESTNQRRTPLMMSSVGEESMKDIWKLLDVPLSPSPGPTFEVPETGPPPSPLQERGLQNEKDGMQVLGSRTKLSSKPQQQQKMLSSKAQGRVRQVPTKQKRPQIRNYNVRDGIT